MAGSLQRFSDVFQKDIEDLFVRQTLTRIQEIVRNAGGVSFAQVGRSTVATLSGVETAISSEARSAFEVSQPPDDFKQLLDRAKEIKEISKDLVPAVGDTEIAKAGPLDVSQVIGLAIALSEQNIKPINVKTGTNLTFTPGVLRDLNSAEINIKLEVVDPEFKATAEEDTRRFSRVGKQTVNTSVYTQAMDFFDLSTFTSQATLDGGRFLIPVIGHIWRALFSGIPVFGDLFSVPRGNQNVFHESLLLLDSAKFSRKSVFSTS